MVEVDDRRYGAHRLVTFVEGNQIRANQLTGLNKGFIMSGPTNFVDEDEPGIDPELERLTQPHTVLSQPRYQRFADEEVRKRTFSSWTNTYPTIMMLVTSGFFFLGGRDSVQCFHCGIILHSWEEADIPDEEHKTHSPNCAFLKIKKERQRIQDLDDRYSLQNDSPEVQQRHTGQQEQRIIQAVAGLGHSTSVIERAMHGLKVSGQHNIDTNMLVDAVFEIENNEDFPETETPVVADYSAISTGVPMPPGTVSQSQPILKREMTSQESGEETQEILERARKLEKENEDLRKQTTCRVCFEHPATEVFLPCGHLACCENCSGQLTECPYCRKKIIRTVHVFLP